MMEPEYVAFCSDNIYSGQYTVLCSKKFMYIYISVLRYYTANGKRHNVYGPAMLSMCGDRIIDAHYYHFGMLVRQPKSIL